jgi:uracil-DNA glycosylase
MSEQISDLEQLAALAATCTRCRLSSSRTQVVFGDGNPDADLMFVGEAPGYYEDKQGLPFVGPSGQLLNRLLAGIGLRREDVYICNVVKSRPPGNRDPQADEIAACRDWLDGQIRIIDPKVIVTLGNFASKTLLETGTGITRLRGRTYPFQGRVLLPTFHPSAALRADTSGRAENRTLKGMEEDFQALARLLQEQRPTPSEPPDPPGAARAVVATSGPAAEDAEPEDAEPEGAEPEGEQLGLF